MHWLLSIKHERSNRDFTFERLQNVGLEMHANEKHNNNNNNNNNNKRYLYSVYIINCSRRFTKIVLKL